MASIPKTTSTEKRFETRVVLDGVRWSTYEALAQDLGCGAVRLAYDGGLLEVMSPAPAHETYKHRLRRMIDVITIELNISVRGAGSTTFR